MGLSAGWSGTYMIHFTVCVKSLKERSRLDQSSTKANFSPKFHHYPLPSNHLCVCVCMCVHKDVQELSFLSVGFIVHFSFPLSSQWASNLHISEGILKIKSHLVVYYNCLDDCSRLRKSFLPGPYHPHPISAGKYFQTDSSPQCSPGSKLFLNSYKRVLSGEVQVAHALAWLL